MIMPNNIEAEKILIGSMLIDPMLINEITAVVKADEFYNSYNKRVYEEISALNDKDRDIDIFIVADKCGKFDEMQNMIDSVIVASNYRHYVYVVKNSARRRKIITNCLQAIEGAKKNEIGKSLELIEEIIKVSDEGSEFDTPKTLAPEVIDMIEGISKGDERIIGIKSGWGGLDDIIDGIKSGEVTFISGPTKVGKTTFALNLIDNWSIRRGKPLRGAVFSYEMSNKYLLYRMILNLAGLSTRFIKDGDLEYKSEKWGDIINAGNIISDKPLHLFDMMKGGVSDVLRKARVIKRTQGLDYIIVDHLHLINETSFKGGRTEEVGYIAKELKRYAKILDIPIICLAQLSRKFEDRTDKRPHYSDLRNSGEIEHIAGLILLLHCPGMYGLKDSRGFKINPNCMELIVDLNRFGSTGSAFFKFEREYMRYSESRNWEEL